MPTPADIKATEAQLKACPSIVTPREDRLITAVRRLAQDNQRLRGLLEFKQAMLEAALLENACLLNALPHWEHDERARFIDNCEMTAREVEREHRYVCPNERGSG